MERETLLAILITLLGGLVLQLFAARPVSGAQGASFLAQERRRSRALWYPVLPALLVAAWLCGWAIGEPDPVHDPLDPVVVILLALPFALLLGRAGVRAVWSLLRRPVASAVSTVGLLQPQVVFSPFLAKQLEDSVIRAALAHELAHARHRDPLRIWLAQLITDLQWPWPAAQRRLGDWLAALELARDEEARQCGIDGADLAAAVLASVRFLQGGPAEQRIALSDTHDTQWAHARLIGDARALEQRVSYLLAPVPPAAAADAGGGRFFGTITLFAGVLASVLVLGAIFGEPIMHRLLGLTVW